MPANQSGSVLLIGGRGLLGQYVVNALAAEGGVVYSWDLDSLVTVDSSRAAVSGPEHVAAIWYVLSPEGEADLEAGVAFITQMLTTLACRLTAERVVVVACDVQTLLAAGSDHHVLEVALERVGGECRAIGLRFCAVRVGPLLTDGYAAGASEPASNLKWLLEQLLPHADSSHFAELLRGAGTLRVLSGRSLERRLREIASVSHPDSQHHSIYVYGDEILTLGNLLLLVRLLAVTTSTPLTVRTDRSPELIATTLRRLGRTMDDAANSDRDDEGDGVVVDDITNELAQYIRWMSGDSACGIFEEIQFCARDGVPLRAYHRPAVGEPLLFVNAYGMSADLLVPLARDLEETNWYTMESRYVPAITDEFNPERTGVKHHADDLFDLLDFLGLEKVHLAGWCTGAQVALKFAHDHPERVHSLILVNGAYALASLREVEFHRSILGLLDRAAAGVATATPVQRMLYSDFSLQSAQVDGNSCSAENKGSIPRQRNPHLAQMLSQLFRNPTVLNRYAKMAVRLWDEPEHAWTEAVDVPTLVLTGSEDVMSPPHTSVELAGMLPVATLVEMVGGDHYMLYGQAERVASEITTFLRSVACRSSAGSLTAGCDFPGDRRPRAVENYDEHSRIMLPRGSRSRIPR